MSDNKQIPTQEQLVKTDELRDAGYIWDKQLSMSVAGVALVKGKDIWIFDLEGGIHHNPELTTIKL